MGRRLWGRDKPSVDYYVVRIVDETQRGAESHDDISVPCRIEYRDVEGGIGW